MIKLKFFVGLAVVLGALMATAGPALAEFQSIPSKGTATSGSFVNVASGELLAKNSKGEVAAKTTCPNISGEWKIRSTGKISEETKGPNQQPTKRGPHQQFQVKWETTVNGCLTTAGGVTVPSNVEECQLQIHQQRGVVTNVKADVLTTCVIKVGAIGCTITVPAANEATGANFQLSKVDLENKEGKNDLIKASVTGLTNTSEPSCAGVAAGNSAELQGLEIEALGEIQV